MDTAAIEAKNLSVEYKSGHGKKKLAVEDLSFRVNQGEIVGFIGPNGAGKTSTIKALLDFSPVAGGTCFVSGVPSSNPKARQYLGYMPEISYYPKYLTLSEFLHTCAAVSGLTGHHRREAVMSVVQRVGMEQHLKSKLSSFSKGMLQQAGFAQAMVHNPGILILDEPMSGLDPIARMKMRRLLAQLQCEGKTILFSSHELGEIEMVADRVLIINAGKLVYQGPISQIVGMDNNLEQAFIRLLGVEQEVAAWAA